MLNLENTLLSCASQLDIHVLMKISLKKEVILQILYTVRNKIRTLRINAKKLCQSSSMYFHTQFTHTYWPFIKYTKIRSDPRFWDLTKRYFESGHLS